MHSDATASFHAGQVSPPANHSESRLGSSNTGMYMPVHGQTWRQAKTAIAKRRQKVL